MSQTETIPIPARRKLGWGLAALVVAGNMIGSGVYLAPVALASTGSSSLIGWLVCGGGRWCWRRCSPGWAGSSRTPTG